MHDIIIIGGGPAGLTAAIYARRANKSVLVLEKDGFGGQMTHSPNIENFPGFTQISGNELADKMMDQVMALGADVEIEEALEITVVGDKKIVKTDFGTHECSVVITAMGAKHRLLGAPGEEKFIGDGISFCAVCDGAFYNGKRVAVIGGGNSALQEAILLSELCTEVTIIQNLDFDYCTIKLPSNREVTFQEFMRHRCFATTKENKVVFLGLFFTSTQMPLWLIKKSTCVLQL